MVRVLLAAISLLLACKSDPPAPVEKTAPPAPVEQLDPAKVRPKGIVPTTTRPTQDPHEAHGPPDFVKRGSGVFEEQGKRWFYGVGKAKGTENMMRAHMLADRAAAAELQNQLRAYNQTAIDVMGFEIRTKADNYAVAQVEKSEIVDHWIDHDNDEWYSLRRFEAASYAEGLAKTLEMSDEVRTKIGPP